MYTDWTNAFGSSKSTNDVIRTAQKHALSVFCHVGAIPSDDPDYNYMIQNDSMLERDVLATLGITWELPLGIKHEREIANLDQRYGGKNFLKLDFSTKPVDVLVLHNIPEYDGNIQGGIKAGAQKDEGYIIAMKRAANSFSVCEDHSAKAWRAQIEKSGAKFVFLYGADTFRPEDLQGASYSIVPYELMRCFHKQVLVRNDYMGDLIPHLDEINPKFGEFVLDNAVVGRPDIPLQPVSTGPKMGNP